MSGIPPFFCVNNIHILLDYDRHILRILTEAGETGISVQKLSLHVYNASNSLFESASLEEVRRYVQQYLLRNSKSQESIIESTGQRGYYRLNLRSQESQQLMLMFRDDMDEVDDSPEVKDLSLDLFAI